MTVHEAKTTIHEALKGLYSEREVPVLTGLLLEWATGIDRTHLMLEPGKILTGNEQVAVTNGLEALIRFEPVQYITGRAWFYGMELKVNRDVLIPRPETEELVRWILEDRGAGNANLKILDLGTGSGCIALALKKMLPKAEVVGADISENALDIARKNSESLQLSVEWILKDMLEAGQWQDLGEFGILVSNPPYVMRSEIGSMLPNVVEYEPHAALFVSDQDPLEFYRAIAGIAHEVLDPDGALYLEINEKHGAEISALLQTAGFGNVTLKQDMQGKPRMIRAYRK